MCSFSLNALRSDRILLTAPFHIILTILNSEILFYRPLNSGLYAKNKGKSNEMIDFIEKPMDGKTMVGDAPTSTPEEDDLADLVRCIVRAADGRKAENIVALRVSSVSTLTTFVVVSYVQSTVL